MDVLEKGGNAVDAAVAAVLAVGVAQPVSSGIGGGGFAMVYVAKTRTTTVLDFRETAPIGLRVQELDKRPPDDAKRGVGGRRARRDRRASPSSTNVGASSRSPTTRARRSSSPRAASP